MKQPKMTMPPAEPVMLHACCAPCSLSITEWMILHGIHPTIYFYNPNIYPVREYVIRREESRRHAAMFGFEWIEGPYDHEAWLKEVEGLENEPERGSRCQRCFDMRLRHTAEQAKAMGYGCLTTTLASSRWKSQEQLEEAGAKAQDATGLPFWPQNWRKDGLVDRRSALLREYSFYNQQYCGCEFSRRGKEEKQKEPLRTDLSGSD